MTTFYSRDEIKELLKAKTIIEYICRENDDAKITSIHNELKCIIKEKCNHELVYDLIDAGNDKQMHITYCIHCSTTF